MDAWVREALIHGGILCAFMTAVVVASLWQNPKIWVHDAPPAIQVQVGPVDERTKRQRTAWGIVTFAGLALTFGRLVLHIVEQNGNGYPFWTVFAASFICFELFNLFDALIIDISLAAFQPRWAMIPGVDMSALRDPRWHLRAFLIGLVMGIPFAGVVTGLGWMAKTLLPS